MWIYRIAVALILLRWLQQTLGLWSGWRRLTPLDRVAPGGDGELPSLSIVVPALNEEATAEAAMRTLLALDYPDLQIIAVDDRSTDATGAILDRLSAEEPRLRVLHVRELPEGWLGKSHAMHLGAGEASGEWILFTDADVHFEPTALRRAVAHGVRTGAGHVVVMPEVIARGFWERVILCFFWIAFSFRWQPRKVADPGRKDYIGIGAFNLVRGEAYRRSGGYAAMPLEILDDVKLGKLLKESGARPACLPGAGMVRVRWVEGLGGAVRGLTKNLFASFDFSLARSLASSAVLAAGAVWPLFGLFTGPLETRLMCAAVFGLMVWSVTLGVQVRGLSPLYGLTFPLGASILLYALLRSIVLTYLRGGVLWRGTLYPLSVLRRGRV